MSTNNVNTMKDEARGLQKAFEVFARKHEDEIGSNIATAAGPPSGDAITLEQAFWYTTWGT